MSTYRGIRGTLVSTRTSNPDNPNTGDIWYRSDTGDVQLQVNLGSWATGGNMNTGRFYLDESLLRSNSTPRGERGKHPARQPPYRSVGRRASPFPDGSSAENDAVARRIGSVYHQQQTVRSSLRQSALVPLYGTWHRASCRRFQSRKPTCSSRIAPPFDRGSS